MWRMWLFALILITTAACNLSMSAPTSTPAISATEVALSQATFTPIPTENTIRPTLLPLPGLPATNVPVTSVPLLGEQCAVYTTYSGTDPNNKLSLRAEPSVSATQIFRVPTDTQVLLLPGSTEVEAEDYHWLHVIYAASPQMRYQGWIARDSYSTGGVRNPSIATLRATGTFSAC